MNKPQRQSDLMFLRSMLRIGVGLVLVTAALLKGHQLATERVVSTGILSDRPFLSAAVVVEMLLGLWLISGWSQRTVGWIACACFSLFAGVAWWKMRGGEPSCGCFGRVAVKPWVSLAIDLSAIPVSLWLALGPQRPQRFSGRVQLMVGVAALALLGLPAFVKMAFYGPAGRPDVKKIVLDPAKWPGKPWLLGQYIDAWPDLSRGRWVVVMYSPDCEECQPTLKAYGELAQTWKSAGRAERIALIATTEADPIDGFPDLSKTPALRGRLDVPVGVHWYIPSPTLVVMTDGQVRITADGDGHCDWNEAKFGKW